MILKGNQRAGGRQMAVHLLSGQQNEHVTVHEVRGFIASDILGALNEAKSLYLEHGWKMPEGFRDKNLKNPLNYTRAEWQQAARIGRNPANIKRELQECWAVSDNKKSFENILRESGYYLARGDRRGYVVVDVHGEVFSLPRQLGLKKKAVAARLGNPEELPSVTEKNTHQ